MTHDLTDPMAQFEHTRLALHSIADLVGIRGWTNLNTQQQEQLGYLLTVVAEAFDRVYTRLIEEPCARCAAATTLD